jgi:glycosyltransferase involved in cell wall biosynthesis
MPYSVVIPAYNAGATLRETLDSVWSQTIRPAEIIVVDDGSTDDTAEIARGFSAPIRLMSQENAGPGSATTKGFAAVRSAVVATLDSDDLWLPEKMEAQLAHLRAYPATAGVFTHWRVFRDGGAVSGNAPSLPGWSRTTLAIRTDAATRIGAVIDAAGKRGEMIDWIGRGREAGLIFEMLPETLALRRIRPGSLSYGRDSRDRGYAQVAWLAIQRRKARGAAG